MKAVHSRIIVALLAGINVLLLLKMGIGKYLTGSLQLWDFDIYYRMVNDGLRGANVYQLPYMETSGPPLVILPFVPFTLLPLPAARILVALLSLASIYVTSWLLAKKIDSTRQWLVTLACSSLLLLSFPVRFNFDVGQLNLISMALVTWLILHISKAGSGFVVSLLVVMKTNFVVLFVSLMKKRPTVFAWAVRALIAWILISAFLFKPSSYLTYISDRAVGYTLESSATVGTDYYNQSLRATMARLELGELYLPLFLLCLALGALYLIRTGDIIGGIMLSLILSPIIWQHYIPIVYPIMIYMAHQMYQRRRFIPSFILAIALLVLHIPSLHSANLTSFTAALSSHYFVGLLILYISWVWWKRPRTFTAEVLHGEKLGRTIGYPTVNLDPQVLHGYLKVRGVYAAIVHVDGKAYNGALYFGPRAVLGETVDVLEIHILEFKKSIYGKHLTFEIQSFIRGVAKLNSLAELKLQLSIDIEHVRTSLSPHAQEL